jgi:uncharacterized membrane protein HdeD (DUF308 family)
MARIKKLDKSIAGDMARNWGWLLGLGVLFVILGCIGVSMAVGLTLISIVFLGLLFIVAGVAQIIDVFKSKQWKGAIYHALIAVLYIAGGSLVIYDPILASAIITALLAWVLIIIGITRLIMAIVLRHSTGWGWLLFAGLVSIILGGLILMQWPFSALWIIGLFIAIELMVNGWSYIFIAFAMRR